MKKRFAFPAALFFASLFLSSCIGMSAGITLKPDGSGTLTMEYRISTALESLGKLSGNERWPTLPVGKADFERSVRRLDGVKLVSFASKNTNEGIINTVKLDFSNRDALLRLLDASGRRVSFGTSGENRLSLVLIEKVEKVERAIDPDLLALFTALAGTFSLSLSVPSGEARVQLYDGGGQALSGVAGATVQARGKTVSFSAPLGVLLNLSQGLMMEIRWQ
jgi:hypothetical protein